MDLDRDLNPEQRKAVLHGSGPLLVLAGAGSGKTRVITYRIARLIKERQVAPHRILAVTFTNKAAFEMRERVDGLVGKSYHPWISTFHAFGARVLRQHAELLGYTKNFVIYDEDDAHRLGRAVLGVLGLDPESHPADRFLRNVERAKHRLKAPGEGGVREGEEADFYVLYQKRLKQANALDFADLIFLTHRLWMRFPEVLDGYRRRFEHVLVDEFQDTDWAQYSLLRQLCPPEANLCVVGDDDQSIYMWRDAEIGNILGFKHDYPKARVVVLERNYRSTANILRAASCVIARNQSRHRKALWTEDGPGEPVLLDCLADEREEAKRVAVEILNAAQEGEQLSEMAVFYRVNAQSRALEEAFRLFGIPYLVVGGTRFFDRMEIRDLVAYLRLLVNPKSSLDLLRVINVPPRGIGRLTQERLGKIAEAADLSIWEILDPDRLSDLRKSEREKVLGFKDLLEGLREQAGGLTAAQIIELTMERSGYRDALLEQGTDTSLGRLENLEELLTAARDVAGRIGEASLEGFLEHVALVTDLDLAEGGAEAVNLMTLHAAKGLEFGWVFMVGMEERLLPHYRSLDLDEAGRPAALEEERRLCYVGMTRARKHLRLSCACSRAIFGRIDTNEPSRFINDLPEGSLRVGGWPARHQVIDLADVDLDEGDGIWVDYGDDYAQMPKGPRGPTDALRWVGMWVTHASFGRGRVLQARTSGNGLKLLIDFESVGQKTVFSEYVRPSAAHP